MICTNMMRTVKFFYYDGENYNEYDNSVVQVNHEGDTDIEPPAKIQKIEEGSIFKLLPNKFRSLESACGSKTTSANANSA